jgi:hypothetical protein
MLERLAAGDYEAALLAADSILLHQPRHQDALDCAQIARSELRRTYLSRLGALERVPSVGLGHEGLMALALDFRAGMVVARIDGVRSVADVVASSALPELDALRILSELALTRAVVFTD